MPDRQHFGASVMAREISMFALLVARHLFLKHVATAPDGDHGMRARMVALPVAVAALLVALHGCLLLLRQLRVLW